LDIYGRVRTFAGRSLNECNFRFQGQYEDVETGLYYNRFRYYDPSTGNYISQDPIRLAGNNPTLYGYVEDPNTWIDVFGLDITPNKAAGLEREAIAKDWLQQKHPNADILSERYLKDAKGKSIYDTVTDSRRRVDFVVVENGKVVGVYEVTSPTADKTAQLRKEERIRSRGQTYIKEPGRNGKLHNISDIETRRLDVDLNTKKVKCH